MYTTYICFITIANDLYFWFDDDNKMNTNILTITNRVITATLRVPYNFDSYSNSFSFKINDF